MQYKDPVILFLGISRLSDSNFFSIYIILIFCLVNKVFLYSLSTSYKVGRFISVLESTSHARVLSLCMSHLLNAVVKIHDLRGHSV